MYRAYHAIRGQPDPTASPRTRPTVSSRCFASCLRIINRDILASFDLAVRRFDPRWQRITRQPHTDAGRPCEQVPWVHEACEAMGVLILTPEATRG
jgi:hypothetical protein